MITQDAGYRRGAEVKLEGRSGQSAAAMPHRQKRAGLPAHRLRRQHAAGRDHWWHELMEAASADCPAEPLDSEHPLVSALYLRHHRQTQRHSAHHRRICRRNIHHDEMGFRFARRRHLLVHGRYRLGDRPQLHRLRSAAERRHRGDVRRRPDLAGAGSLLEDHREISGQYLLHRAHGHPRLHALGRAMAAQA